uniref:Uncharacterized protein n=1 Tax=Ananas comosus var. bracteatus TaxID=296719 RepID=A0A6V7Q352_ANACO|nr:unnamed protein product [Ananas comosus var. bracteatus]
MGLDPAQPLRLFNTPQPSLHNINFKKCQHFIIYSQLHAVFKSQTSPNTPTFSPKPFPFVSGDRSCRRDLRRSPPKRSPAIATAEIYGDRGGQAPQHELGAHLRVLQCVPLDHIFDLRPPHQFLQHLPIHLKMFNNWTHAQAEKKILEARKEDVLKKFSEKNSSDISDLKRKLVELVQTSSLWNISCGT